MNFELIGENSSAKKTLLFFKNRQTFEMEKFVFFKNCRLTLTTPVAKHDS